MFSCKQPSLHHQICLFQTALTNAKHLLPTQNRLITVLRTLNSLCQDIKHTISEDPFLTYPINQPTLDLSDQIDHTFREQCKDEWVQMNLSRPKHDFNFDDEEHNVKRRGSFRGSYRSYSTSLKETIWKLHREKGLSFSQISQSFNIPIKNIARWCKFGYQRKIGAGRKVSDPEMQQRLCSWIKETYSEGMSISYRKIQVQALEYSQVIEFKASKCWLKNFLRRKNLAGRYQIGWRN